MRAFFLLVLIGSWVACGLPPPPKPDVPWWIQDPMWCYRGYDAANPAPVGEGNPPPCPCPIQEGANCGVTIQPPPPAQ